MAASMDCTLAALESFSIITLPSVKHSICKIGDDGRLAGRNNTTPFAHLTMIGFTDRSVP